MTQNTAGHQGPLQDDITERRCAAWSVTLYIGGSVDEIKSLLARRAAVRGACWSVEPTEFIYSGGREAGAIVRQIAYARFPGSAEQALEDMLALGKWLMHETGQGSFSVLGPTESVFVSRRKGD